MLEINTPEKKGDKTGRDMQEGGATTVQKSELKTGQVSHVTVVGTSWVFYVLCGTAVKAVQRK